MKLEEKFKRGIETRTYQRVDPEYCVDIFLGYNDEGRMSLVITEDGPVQNIKSSKEIEVQLKRRGDGKLALSFNLLDNTYSSLFLIFCKDLILTCEQSGKRDAISSAILRWKYWRNLFGKRPSDVLNKNEIKGLIGELILLRDVFFAEYGESNAVKSWMGPIAGHKDFEIYDTWYEVKSINEAALQVTISSIEQLESDIDGHLAIVRLEDTNELVDDRINLNNAVASVVEKITDPDIMDLFKRKLNLIGYNYNPIYDDINFLFKGMEFYVVNEKFPRLRRNRINPSIGNAKYSIILEGIGEFKEN